MEGASRAGGSGAGDRAASKRVAQRKKSVMSAELRSLWLSPVAWVASVSSRTV